MEPSNIQKLVKPIGGSHDFYVYDLNTFEIQEHSLSLSHSFCEDYGICYLDSNNVMVSGGYNPSSGLLVDYSFIINLNTLNVQNIAPLPVKLKGLRLVSHFNEAYSVAGCTEQDSGFTLEGFFFKYKPGLNAWIRLAEMPLPCVFPGVFVQDSNIWVTGGLTKNPETIVLDAIRTYNIDKNSWSLSNLKLLRPSYLHGCAIYPDGHVLIYGGLRDQMSNRFSYWLGSSTRKELPEKHSMSFIEPSILYNKLYAFNDEMTLFEYENNWKISSL